MCEKHYKRWRVHGDPLAANYKHHRPRRRNGQPVTLEWIRRNSTVDEHGCWIWGGKRRGEDGRADLGGVGWDGERQLCRIAWKLLNDRPIPKGLEASHICLRGKDGCCNPDHIVIESHADNMRRERL